MAKKIAGYIKLQIPGGAANPSPPVGPALGQKGVNIMQFCKAFNAQTQNEKGMIIPVVITVYADKSFTFITKVPPVAILVKKAVGIETASGEPNRKKVGKITKAQVKEIATKKMPDLNTNDIEAAMRMVAGTARSMASMLSTNQADLNPISDRKTMFRGKKYKKVAEAFDRAQAYGLEQALEILKKSEVKFDQTVELHFNLGVDPKNSDQAVRGTVVLPNGTGRQVRVLVFCKDNNFQAAQDAGADYVGGADLVQKIQEGWLEFDAVVATPDMMPVISKIARVLGPRGLMPSPKSGTVTINVAQTVKELKAGKNSVPCGQGREHSRSGRQNVFFERTAD